MPPSLRIGLRSLRRTPGFTAVVVLTLAIGIGATTAIFSVVDAVPINPLPYPTADRLEMIWVTNPQQAREKDVTSYPNFTDWQSQATTFETMAAVSGANFTVTGAGEPRLVPGERVTGRFFDLLGMPALHGRTFQEADTQPGRESVLVLSHALWREHFGADAAVIGRTVSVNARPYEIVGVMPHEFSAIHTAQAWAPLSPSGPYAQLAADRGPQWLEVIGLVKHGTPRESAQTEMSTIMGRLAEQYPGPNGGRGILLESLQETVVRGVRPTLLLLAGAAVLVLLIVCANVAGLLVARLSARQREMAVRVAIGAGRGHLIRQLLVESLLLTMRLTLPGARYPQNTDARTFYTSLIERIEAIPGVERAGAMSFPMLSRSSGSASLRIEGAPPPPPGTPNEPVTMDVITPTAFEALGVRSHAAGCSLRRCHRRTAGRHGQRSLRATVLSGSGSDRQACDLRGIRHGWAARAMADHRRCRARHASIGVQDSGPRGVLLPTD